MNCEVTEIELQAFASGELAAARAHALEAHVAGCARCARFLEEERALTARLAALPRAVAPGPDVWRAIEERIGEARPPARVNAVLRRPRWHIAAGGFALAAAAAAAIVASRPSGTNLGGSAMTTVANEKAAPPKPEAAPHDNPPSLKGEGTLPEEQPYLTALTALEADFATAKSALPEEAARGVDDNLRVLDTAIGATRSALSTQPDSLDLKSQLADSYQQKVHVETDVIDLAARI